MASRPVAKVLYDSGALLTRVAEGTPADEWEMVRGSAETPLSVNPSASKSRSAELQEMSVPNRPCQEPGHVYWNPHVDKANIATCPPRPWR